MKHFNIPVFIPELACPNQCVYCDQRKISGKTHIPGVQDVHHIIRKYLSTLPSEECRREVAFFGGNFTGLPLKVQRSYLDAANQWLSKGLIHGIRLSTRPDYVNREVMDLMKNYGVSCMELGVQSLDEEVLRLSGRGHTAEQAEEAAAMVREAGIKLGLQMMTGLPGDSPEKSLYTARRIADLGASITRIYPALVIKGTALHRLMEAGSYKPLSLEETIERCKTLLLFFESREISVIRLGLHPSEGLIGGCELAAGPFHPALRELVMTALWEDIFRKDLLNGKKGILQVTVAPAQINAAIGHKGANKKMLGRHYRRVLFKTDPQLKKRAYYADHC